MGATTQDRSGIFDAELKPTRGRHAAVLADAFHLTSKGITFISDQFLPEWTEVDVEMMLPGAGTRKDHQIGCRGVVVRCARHPKGKGFEVALLFLDLSQRAQAQLTATPMPSCPCSISISR